MDGLISGGLKSGILRYIIYQLNILSFDPYNKNLLNKDLFDSLGQFYTDLLLKRCQRRQKLL